MKIMQRTLVASCLAMAMSACTDSSSDSPAAGPQAPEVAESIGNVFSLTFIDGSGQLLAGNTRIELTGEGSQYLSEQTIAATAQTQSFVVNDGILDLVIADEVKDEVDELIITAVIHNADYTSTSTTIRIDPSNPGETYVAPIQLVAFSTEVNDSEEAVVFVGATEEVNDAKLATPIEIDTQSQVTENKDTTALAGGGAKISIDSDVQMQTADGQPMTGSQVEVKMNYFSNEPVGSGDSEASALDSFPGGFDVVSADVEDSNDTVEDFAFISAGFVAVDITSDQGEAIKKFDKPISIEMKVPEGTVWNVDADQDDVINSEVPADEIGNTLADIASRHPGKKLLLPVWSYEEADGKWTKAKEPATVILDVNDPTYYDAASKTYITTMAVTHLSFWNLDWVKTRRCAPSYKKIDVFLQDGQTPNPLHFYPSLRASGFSGTGYFSSNYPNYLSINNVPDIHLALRLSINGSSAIDAVRTNATNTFSRDAVTNGVYRGSLCDVNAIRLNKTLEEVTIEPKVNVQAVCRQDPSLVTEQPARVTLQGYRYYQRSTIEAGDTATFPRYLGETVTFNVTTFVNGLGSQSEFVTFTPENEEFTMSYPVECQIPTGTGSGSGSGSSGGGGD